MIHSPFLSNIKVKKLVEQLETNFIFRAATYYVNKIDIALD